MKKKENYITLNIIFCLFLLLILTLAQPEDEILQVRSYDENKVFEMLFIHNNNYQQNCVITDDQTRCLPIETGIEECKRINTRFVCQEHRSNYVALKQSNMSIAKIYIDYCQIISDDLSSCVMPQFGYTYKIPEKEFTQVDFTFCAVFNSTTGKCEKYYYRFLPVQDKDYSVFLKDFFNFDKIAQGSHSKQITCQSGYKLHVDSALNRMGCLEEVTTEKNCYKFNEINECSQCNAGYVINGVTGVCEPNTFPNCLIFQNLDIEPICLKCLDGYLLKKGRCIASKNCIYSNGLQCIACQSPFYGKYCELTNPSDTKCALKSMEGKCLRCKDNDFMYSIIYDCSFRVHSLQCKDKHPLGDYCNSQKNELNKYFKDGKNNESFNLELNKLFKSAYEYYNAIGVNFLTFSELISNTKIENCIEYSLMKNICLKCSPGLYLWYDNVAATQICQGIEPPVLPSQFEGCNYWKYVQSNQCKECDQGYAWNIGKGNCIKIPEQYHCLEGYKDSDGNWLSCYKCQPGYSNFNGQMNCMNISLLNLNSKSCSSLIKVTSTNIDYYYECSENKDNCSVKNKDSSCEQCSFGYTLYVPTNKCIVSTNELLNCLYTTNLTICTQCRSAFSFKNNKCESYTPVSIPEPTKTCAFFIYNDVCAVCQKGYVLFDTQCLEWCKGTKDQDYCDVLPPDQCPNECEQCTDFVGLVSPKQCIKCKDPQDKLENGQCVKLQQCPIGQYLEGNICINCPPYCLTCTSVTQCQSCSSAETSPNNNCQCPSDKLLFQNKCVSNCPFGWQIDVSKSCKRVCEDGQFMEYKEDKKQFECSTVLDEKSNYCLQVIEQIPNLVKLKLKKILTTDDIITLVATLNETPSNCYTYQMIGKSSYEIPIEYVSTLSQVSLTMKVPKKDIFSSDKVEFDTKYAYLYLKIFYQNYLQYSVRVRITYTYDLILSNDFQYIGEHKIIDPICEDCEVPTEKLITATTKVTCPSETTCDSSKISVYTNSEIEVVQTIDDVEFKQKTIQPHSVKIKFTSDSKEQIFQIKNYLFDNTIPGQITYKFKAIGGYTGQLVVTSKVLSSARLLQSTSNSVDSPYRYSQETYEITIKDYQEDEEGLSLTYIIIIVSISSIIATLLVVLLINRIYKRKKLMRIANYIDKSETSNIQFQKDNIPEFNNEIFKIK